MQAWGALLPLGDSRFRRPLRLGLTASRQLPARAPLPSVDAKFIFCAALAPAGIAALVFTPWIPKALAKPELAKNAIQLGSVAVRDFFGLGRPLTLSRDPLVVV